MTNKNILFISGIPDNNLIKACKTHPDGSILQYIHGGTCNFFLYMDPPDWNKLPAVLDSRRFPLHFDPATHCIINEIAEPDSHSKTLDYLQQLLDSNPHIPVLNAPHTVQMTRRDRVYEALQGIPGLIVPHTVRFHPKHLNDIIACMDTHQMTYPLILKAAGEHGGKSTLRFDTLEELKEGLYPMALDGQPYYLIAYHDTSQNGIFSKYRFIMVNGKPYPRHFRFSDHWMVHYYSAIAFMNAHPDYYTKEESLFERFLEGMPPTFLQTLETIHQRIPIDYTGIDLTVDPEGNIVLFEMNPNMLILITDEPDIPYFVSAIERLKQAVYELIDQKIKTTQERTR